MINSQFSRRKFLRGLDNSLFTHITLNTNVLYSDSQYTCKTFWDGFWSLA